jgi:serine/threonine protein phosphatase PrpC
MIDMHDDHICTLRTSYCSAGLCSPLASRRAQHRRTISKWTVKDNFPAQADPHGGTRLSRHASRLAARRMQRLFLQGHKTRALLQYEQLCDAPGGHKYYHVCQIGFGLRIS